MNDYEKYIEFERHNSMALERHNSNEFIASIVERLRGKRISSYEAKLIFTEFLRCMDYHEAHGVIDMIHEEMHGHRPPNNERMRMEYLSERGRHQEMNARKNEWRAYPHVIDYEEKELRAYGLEKKEEDFLSEDEMKI